MQFKLTFRYLNVCESKQKQICEYFLQLYVEFKNNNNIEQAQSRIL